MNFYKTILFSLLIASFSLTTACGSNPTSSPDTAVAIGSPCSATTTCVDGAVCSTSASGGTECQKKCTQATENQDCTGGQKCTSVSDIQGANVSVCLVHGGGGRQGERAATDQACNPNATQPCQETNDLCVPPSNDPSGQTKCRTKCPHGTCSNSTTHECKTTSDQKKVCEEKGDNDFVLPNGCKVSTAIGEAMPVIDQVSSSNVQVQDETGFKTLTFVAGKNATALSSEPVVWINLKTGSRVDITDKQAVDQNTEWDIGLRAYEFYVNGGPFPGDLKMTKVEGDKNAFIAYKAADAKAVPKARYKSGQEVDEECKVVVKNLGGVIPRVYNASMVLNEGRTGFGRAFAFFDYGAGHGIAPEPDVFYVITNKDQSWMAKVRLDKINIASDKAITFIINYSIL